MCFLTIKESDWTSVPFSDWLMERFREIDFKISEHMHLTIKTKQTHASFQSSVTCSVETSPLANQKRVQRSN